MSSAPKEHECFCPQLEAMTKEQFQMLFNCVHFIAQKRGMNTVLTQEMLDGLTKEQLVGVLQSVGQDRQ